MSIIESLLAAGLLIGIIYMGVRSLIKVVANIIKESWR